MTRVDIPIRDQREIAESELLQLREKYAREEISLDELEQDIEFWLKWATLDKLGRINLENQYWWGGR